MLRPGRASAGVWLLRLWETLQVLRRKRPELLFVANPSLALSALALLVRPVFGYFLVIDAHNEGVRPFDRPWPVVGRITRWLLRHADATIVTNGSLASDVAGAGGRAFVLPDPLPLAPSPSGRLPEPRPGPPGLPLIVVVATFRRDEPIANILRAAAGLPNARFVFTGDPSRWSADIEEPAANVRFAGYMPDQDYWDLLRSADLVCDLTLKEACLVCGAYEALAVGKPLLLSDDAATRELFGSAAVYCGSRPAEIIDGVTKALGCLDSLRAAAAELRETYAARWAVQGEAVREAIYSAAPMAAASTVRS